MSEAGVSLASVTIAVDDFLSVVEAALLDCICGFEIFIFSTVSTPGIKAFMTAAEVPGGKDRSCRVGLAAALSSALDSVCRSSSSSEVLNAAEGSFGP